MTKGAVFGPKKESGLQVSVLTLGTLYEAIISFSSQDRFDSFWPSVCQNARWLIPSQRICILLRTGENSFEIAGQFEKGRFGKTTDSKYTARKDDLGRALTKRGAQWFINPCDHFQGEIDSLTLWLFEDQPDTLLVLPISVKGKNIGAILFVMGPVQEADQRMLTALGTVYAQHVGMTYMLIRTTEDLNNKNKELEITLTQLEHELKVAQALLEEAKERVEGPLLGESPAVRGLREAITRHAETDRPLLVTGSRGVGHEAVARAIHHQSYRAKRAFIHMHCAVLQTRRQSILFGSVPAKAQSSAPSKGGKFGLADGGTLYLDGVNELSPAMQKQLAEVLRELQRQRDEGQKPSPDVRVIASTSRDLAAESQELHFNPALHQILSHGQLTVPALAERRDDIPVLVEYFVKQHARRLGKTVDGLTDESMQRLEGYRWPGNIRELENVIERAIVGAEVPLLEIDESFLEGGMILDRYRLVEKLGAGGMGEVWLAKHQLLARPAAVKVIRTDALGNAEQRESMVKRFQREAQTTATLSSPNTVRLYDFGVSETGSFYFVMELLNGINLELMVERFGPLAPERVVMLLRQSCRSLSEAHAAGLVHRDIKPANLFACQMGREYDFLKVLDFGVVKRAISDGDSLLTGKGGITGTPAYMAPEFILGGKEVDGRADLYALGCVAYWMLTGMLVFESDNPIRMMMDHANKKPEPPSRVAEVSIPKSLDELVLACLEKSPDNRPGSADEVWKLLGEVELGEPWTQERAETWWQLHMPELANSMTGMSADKRMSE